tara:strand:+ start:130 stop:525 length:396 start_codon:yes stop_codon:yes gene_type:complete
MADIVEFINESKAEKGKGSKAGRAKMRSGKEHVESSKSRVKVYKSIMDALRKSYIGQPWSTKNSKRQYVTTVDSHGGTSKEQKVGNRIAKGFTGGNFKDVKDFAVRTLTRHGKRREKKFEGSKYWKSRKKK